MKKLLLLIKENGKLIIVTGTSFLLMSMIIICMVCNPFRGKEKTGDEERTVLFLGDSNFVQDYGEGSVPEQFIRDTGYEGFICAHGGTPAANSNSGNNPAKTGSVLDLINLVKMIEGRNILPIKFYAKSINKDISQYKALISANYDSVDYIFLNYALNDYALGVAVRDEANPYNTNTYCGAMRFSIEELQKTFPNAVIIAGSITYNVFVSDGIAADGLNYSYGSGTTLEFRNALKEVCDEYDKVIFLDNLEEFGINYENYKDYLADDMHLHVNGQRLYVNAMKNAVNEVEKVKK